MRKRLAKECFIQDCTEYCDKHNIGTRDDTVLSRCLAIPATGVKVEYCHFENTYYPVLNGRCIDNTIPKYIGKFCCNNGRVVFVYRDGRTMVTRGYWILNELRAARYEEAQLFVPFSNGEQILNPILRKKWDSIR